MIRFRVIDTETTGMELTDEVIEIAYTDVLFDPENRRCEVGLPAALLFKPSIPIPAPAMAVHHITWARVADRPAMKPDDVQLLATDGEPTFLVAHNAAFDRQWITDAIIAEVRTPAPRWICTLKSARRAWPEAPGFSNQALRYWLDVPLDETIADPPHRAGPDTYVTAHILEALLAHTTALQLVKWTMMPEHHPTCPLGKHRGRAWADVPGDFLRWMVEQAEDLKPGVREAAQEERNRRRGA